MNDPTLLTLYAVRNRDGKYFRAKGFNSYGETWVDSLSKARIYPKPGPARAQVTYFATHFPSFGVPELVELHVTRVVALQETARVQQSKDRKAREKALADKRHAEWKLEEARRKLAEAQATINSLGGRT